VATPLCAELPRPETIGGALRMIATPVDLRAGRDRPPAPDPKVSTVQKILDGVQLQDAAALVGRQPIHIGQNPPVR
jgi:hypothetical protein